MAGSVWAVVRHYTHHLPPMLVPVPSATATSDFDEDAGEHEIPIEMLEGDE